MVQCLCFFLLFFCAVYSQAKEVVDMAGRTHSVDSHIRHVICSGPGCLRLLTYLQAQDTVVGVDDIEIGRRQLDARPYAIANPQFKKKPLFGGFRGNDYPEKILTLEPQPQVIFKTYARMGHDPVELERKTGIPVVVLKYGNLTDRRSELYSSLRLMAEILDRQERAEQLITYIEQAIADLEQRTADIPSRSRPSVYLGGVAFKGPHGFQSTEPAYPPFFFLGANNLAAVKIAGNHELNSSTVAKEKILAWDPDVLFLDLSTIRLGNDAGGLYELRHDPSYQILRGVREKRVFGLLPYNMYTSNHGSTLANSYYVGKILYPERFREIIPGKKADEIYEFLVGKPVFETMNRMFDNMVFTAVPVQ